jgi:hypothetical protein
VLNLEASKRSGVILRERTTCNRKPDNNLRATEGPSLRSRKAGSRPEILPLGFARKVLRSAPESVVHAGCSAAPPSEGVEKPLLFFQKRAVILRERTPELS